MLTPSAMRLGLRREKKEREVVDVDEVAECADEHGGLEDFAKAGFHGDWRAFLARFAARLNTDSPPDLHCPRRSRILPRSRRTGSSIG